MTQEERELIAAAKIGTDAESFRTSQLGRYLIGCAEMDLAEATSQIIEVNPMDSARVADLQLRARVAKRFKQWLDEAINNGRQAHYQLKDM